MSTFLNLGNDPSSSYTFFAVTPNDSADQATNFRGLYIGTGGNIVVVNADGVAVTFTNVYDGQILPIRGIRVNATSTTATNIVALV